MPSILAYVHAYSGHGREAGAETTLHDILRNLKEDGWDVDVLLSQGDHDYELDGIRVWSQKDKREINTLVGEYDLLISHLECSKRMAMLAKLAKKPMVHVIHNSYDITYGYMTIKCDFAIYNTFWVQDAHEERGTHAASPVVVQDSESRQFRVPNQLKWPGFVYHPPVDPSQYYCDYVEPRYVTMVNFFKNKGPHIFFELAKRFPHTRFLAVKGGYGDQEIPEFVPHNVTVMENVQDPREFYRKSRVILMPSDYESYGRIAVEAAASGIPSIVTDTPGLRESMKDAATFITDRDNIADWEAALHDLLEKPNITHEAQVKAKERSRELSNQTVWERKEVNELLRQLAAEGSLE